MAAIDSRHRGVLRVLNAENAGDPTDALRQWVSEMTGIGLSLVRRRWSPRPLPIPPQDTDWIAVGIDEIETDGTPYQEGRKGLMDDAESGDVIRHEHQVIRAVLTFYGPNAFVTATLFRESALVFQNISELEKAGMKIRSISPSLIRVPDLVGEQWVDRYDLTIRLARKISTTFGVRSIASVGNINIHTEKGSK